MVGSASLLSDEGEAVDLGAVLKLRFANDNPTSISSSFVSGVLESTNSANESPYFDPLLIFSFPILPMYNYSLFSRQLENGFSGDIDIPRNESLNLEPTKFCSMLFGRYFVFEMEYMEDCKTSTNCSPLADGFLPSFVSLDMIQCSMTRRKVRYTVRFRNITCGVFDQDFDPGWTLIGEGSWDEEKRRILVAACPILQADDDCRIRLSLRYPSTWNIRDDAKIVGDIWTNRTANESGYFREIKLRSSDENDMVVSPGLRYEYTELERARNSCKLIQKMTNNRYPDIDSDDLRFDIYVKNSEGQQFARGDALPLSVGNELYQQTREPFSEKKKNVALVDISFKIGISPSRKIEFHNWSPSLYLSMNLRSRVEITAEGVYDAEAGQVCMIGCRKLFSYNDRKSTNDSTDCEIIVNLEFAPLDARRGGLIKGIIRSTRSKEDPLFFDDLRLLSVAYYRNVAKRSIWRMDLEIVMALISSTLTCIFVGSQLVHVKTNPDILSCVSVLMVVILPLGHAIPLVLNFKALFAVNHGGWLEANEVVMVRVVTMVAFLLEIRLLQLVWTAERKREDDARAAFVSLVMYISCVLTAFLSRKSEDLRSCGGLVLDGVLLPQIVFNAFRGSSEKALANSFYIGISMVRLAPHVYDQCRRRNFAKYYVKGTHYYADSREDLYSTAWDVAIPCGVAALAVIVHLQQRCGGRCILPARFRGLEVYEPVPPVNNA